MQLNLTTDYAIRLLLCLGNTKGTLSGNNIAATTRIPQNYLLKISSKLRKAGMVGSIAGANGGYYLLKPLNKITLLEILKAMEPACKWNHCIEDDRFCSRGAATSYSVRKYYAQLQTELETKWLSRTLSEIVELVAAEEAVDGRQGEMVI